MNLTTSAPLDVACAIIVKEGKILATRRNEKLARGGLWEFPGGKTEPSETAQECIVREIKEELGLEIRIAGTLSPVVHSYPDITIRLIPFLAIPQTDIQFLTDHDNALFLPFDELTKLPWADADRKVLSLLSKNLIFRKLATLQ